MSETDPTFKKSFDYAYMAKKNAAESYSEFMYFAILRRGGGGKKIMIGMGELN